MEKGLIHLYWGDGKGKTTAAMGVAMRGLAAGKKVVFVQFLKGAPSGEIPLLQQLGAVIYRGKAGDKFVFQMTEEEKSQTRKIQNEHLEKALTENADMLILDEATSSIDTRTEIKIQAAFAELMEGRTTFIVAHRLSTVRNSKAIMVLEQGHIIERGSHEELLEQKGRYYQLYMGTCELE